tara:strand:- start:982 stop:1164 length:183 start_codon:yes stop_codon:yes gene_type:complete
MVKKFKYIVNENRDYVAEIEAENEQEAKNIGINLNQNQFEGASQSFWEFVRVEEIKQGEE